MLKRNISFTLHAYIWCGSCVVVFSNTPFPSVHAAFLISIPECFSGFCSCRCLCLLTQTVSSGNSGNSGNSLRPDPRPVMPMHCMEMCVAGPQRSPHSNALLHRRWPHRAFTVWIRQTSYKENTLSAHCCNLQEIQHWKRNVTFFIP